MRFFLIEVEAAASLEHIYQLDEFQRVIEDRQVTEVLEDDAF